MNGEVQILLHAGGLLTLVRADVRRMMRGLPQELAKARKLPAFTLPQTVISHLPQIVRKPSELLPETTFRQFTPKTLRNFQKTFMAQGLL